MKDLEKAIELARKHDELFGIRKREECCVAACQEMAEWKEQQMIEKACEWLKDNANDYLDWYDWEQCRVNKDELLYDFRKAMEGGQND